MLYSHLKSLRERYADFTAPGSELERAKQNADLSQAEAERFRGQMRKQQHELDNVNEKHAALESRLDTTQNEIVVELSNLNR
jgi:predicted  nucleic acid-binding Zn-ribbon protein